MKRAIALAAAAIVLIEALAAGLTRLLVPVLPSYLPAGDWFTVINMLAVLVLALPAVALWLMRGTQPVRLGSNCAWTRDVVTGLWTRDVFMRHLTGAIDTAKTGGQRLAVVLIDMDRFRFVNDSFGHAFGDAALQAMAGKLQACVPNDAMLSRMGGDEFTISVAGGCDRQDMLRLVEAILAAFVEPMRVENHEFHLTPSIGVSVYPEDGADACTLLKHADAAMYTAKKNGGNQYHFHVAGGPPASHDRIQLENELRRALDRNELFLVYQPKLDRHGRRLMGVEALVRWRRQDGTLMSPAEFIPLAEETGLILDIGAWVLKSACQQVKEWLSQDLEPIRVAVNVSARQFQQSDVAAIVKRVLEETALESQYLEVEITESALMNHTDSVVLCIQTLRDMGVHIAIDDFGTGYSSLTYLKRFRINTLKIDRSFVQDSIVDVEDAAIVAAIVNLAHNLQMCVVAEGVETEDQLAYLQDLSCDEVQGYFFSRPLEPRDFARWMRWQRAGTAHAGV